MMTEEEKLDAVNVSEGETLRTETAEAPDVGEHDRLTKLEAELAEAKAAVLYAHAEAQNVRRRAEKETIDARTYAVTGFARDILSVADNLERGLAAIPEELRGDDRMKGLITGLEATKRELDSVFQRNGVTRIAAMGMPLDPNQHQAMLEMPSDQAPGTIVQEMQAGYMLKDRLLRPSMVAVAKKPE
jgi:molecular chaperone GrpE